MVKDMKNKKALYSIGLVIALFVGSFWYKNLPSRGNTNHVLEDIRAAAMATSSSPTISPAKISDGRYTNPNYVFSFLPPAGYAVSAFADTDQSGTPGTTILVQYSDNEPKPKNSGAQILISTWDEPSNTLTPKRIHRDIPSMRINNVSVENMSDIGEVIKFESDNQSYDGKSREAWFVANGDLYQISSYADNQALIDAILSTWKFQ